MNVADLKSQKGSSSATKLSVTMEDLDEKLDRILKYQRTVRHLAVFRGFISFVFFLVFIVLPIIGSVYMFRFIQENIDFEKIGGQYKGFYESLDQIKEQSDKLGNLNELMEKVPLNGNN